MCCAEVMFIDEGSQNVHCMRLNALTLSDNINITAANIGRAQQAIQANFMAKMAESPAKPQIIDVVIHSFTYLGHMTHEEFHAVPEGTELRERVESVLAEGNDSDPASGD